MESSSYGNLDYENGYTHLHRSRRRKMVSNLQAIGYNTIKVPGDLKQDTAFGKRDLENIIDQKIEFSRTEDHYPSKPHFHYSWYQSSHLRPS
ncbi:Calpain-2 Catalytic Subunit [Manis pentadactyla]|nr:Calpain-2 Catalytic Subunit [Manis pentadactyla]